MELPNASRLLIRARLAPLQGSRFQPTGFPDLGAARYRLHDGTEMLLVESAQSVANRMEAVCWNEEARDVVDPLRGLPYVDVWEDGKQLTNSLLEAHRLNSVYIEKSDFRPTLVEAIGYEKDQEKPFDREKLVKAVCKYDPNALLHGVFLESIAGVLRIPRALSGFVEARDVHEVASGGVKNDNVRASKGEEGEARTAKEGYGNVPYHRVEFTAAEIDAFFNLDLAQLRSYRLPPATTRLLYALAVYKIQAFLDRGLRLRTACDFQVLSVEVTRPDGHTLPSEAEAIAALAELIPAAAKEGALAQPAVTRANYSPKGAEKPEKPEKQEKPKRKGKE